MQEIKKITGREYHPLLIMEQKMLKTSLLQWVQLPNTIKEVIDYLMGKGEKVGLIAVHLYRPFSAKYFLNVIPKTVKKIAVLDRTKEPGANGEPLYLDIRDLFYGRKEPPLSSEEVTG